jgi:FixJ family two-component response regulator
MNANAEKSRTFLLCVVDDDSLIRDSTRRLIRSFGFRVETFASAEEFSSSGCLEKTACLILDVCMRGMSGLELQRQLMEANSHTPIIFISAYQDEDWRKQALEAGAVAFLTKPFEQEELLEAIELALKFS